MNPKRIGAITNEVAFDQERQVMAVRPCVACGGEVVVNGRDALPGEGDVYGGFVHFGCAAALSNPTATTEEP